MPAILFWTTFLTLTNAHLIQWVDSIHNCDTVATAYDHDQGADDLTRIHMIGGQSWSYLDVYGTGTGCLNEPIAFLSISNGGNSKQQLYFTHKVQMVLGDESSNQKVERVSMVQIGSKIGAKDFTKMVVGLQVQSLTLVLCGGIDSTSQIKFQIAKIFSLSSTHLQNQNVLLGCQLSPTLFLWQYDRMNQKELKFRSIQLSQSSLSIETHFMPGKDAYLGITTILQLGSIFIGGDAHDVGLTAKPVPFITHISPNSANDFALTLPTNLLTGDNEYFTVDQISPDPQSTSRAIAISFPRASDLKPVVKIAAATANVAILLYFINNQPIGDQLCTKPVQVVGISIQPADTSSILYWQLLNLHATTDSKFQSAFITFSQAFSEQSIKEVWSAPNLVIQFELGAFLFECQKDNELKELNSRDKLMNTYMEEIVGSTKEMQFKYRSFSRLVSAQSTQNLYASLQSFKPVSPSSGGNGMIIYNSNNYYNVTATQSQGAAQDQFKASNLLANKTYKFIVIENTAEYPQDSLIQMVQQQKRRVWNEIRWMALSQADTQFVMLQMSTPECLTNQLGVSVDPNNNYVQTTQTQIEVQTATMFKTTCSQFVCNSCPILIDYQFSNSQKQFEQPSVQILPCPQSLAYDLTSNKFKMQLSPITTQQQGYLTQILNLANYANPLLILPPQLIVVSANQIKIKPTLYWEYPACLPACLNSNSRLIRYNVYQLADETCYLPPIVGPLPTSLSTQTVGIEQMRACPSACSGSMAFKQAASKIKIEAEESEMGREIALSSWFQVLDSMPISHLSTSDSELKNFLRYEPTQVTLSGPLTQDIVKTSVPITAFGCVSNKVIKFLAFTIDVEIRRCVPKTTKSAQSLWYSVSDQLKTFDLGSVFTTSYPGICSAFTYVLIDKQGQTLKLPFVSVRGNSLNVTPTSPGEHSFDVQQVSSRSKQVASVSFKLTVVQTLTDMKPEQNDTRNQPPYWSASLKQSITFDSSSSSFQYESPIVIDPEGDKVAIQLQITNHPPFITIRAFSNYFIMSFDPAKLTPRNQGTYQVHVEVGDAAHPRAQVQFMFIVATYVQTVVETESYSKNTTHPVNSSSEIQSNSTASPNASDQYASFNHQGDSTKQDNISSFQGWKNLLNQSMQKLTRNQTQSSSTPLLLMLRFNRNQTFDLLFNLEIFKPSISTENSSRSLYQVQAEDMFEISLELYDQAITYNVSLLSWESNKISFNCTFSDQLAVSQRAYHDILRVKLKDPSLFVATSTGAGLNLTHEHEYVALIPTQFPTNVNAETVSTVVSTTKTTLNVLMYISIALQILLKGTFKKMIDFFLATQMIIYLQMCNTQLPAITDMVMAEFINVVEFNSLNVQSIVQIWKPEFSLLDWMLGYQLQNSLFENLLVMITLAVGCVIFICLLGCLSKFFFKRLQSYFKKIIQRMFWNGLVVSLTVSHFKIVKEAAQKLTLETADSKMIKEADSIVSVLILVGLACLSLFIMRFLSKNKSKFDDQAFQAKHNMLYNNINTTKDEGFAVFSFPVFLLHRIAFGLISCLLYFTPGLSIELIIMLHLKLLMFKFWFRPAIGPRKLMVSRITDIVIHSMTVQLLLWTDLVLNKSLQFTMGFVFFGQFMLVCVINLASLGVQLVTYCRKKKSLLKAGKKQLRRMSQMIILPVHYNSLRKSNGDRTKQIKWSESEISSSSTSFVSSEQVSQQDDGVRSSDIYLSDIANPTGTNRQLRSQSQVSQPEQPKLLKLDEQGVEKNEIMEFVGTNVIFEEVLPVISLFQTNRYKHVGSLAELDQIEQQNYKLKHELERQINAKMANPSDDLSQLEDMLDNIEFNLELIKTEFYERAKDMEQQRQRLQF